MAKRKNELESDEDVEEVEDINLAPPPEEISDDDKANPTNENEVSKNISQSN